MMWNVCRDGGYGLLQDACILYCGAHVKLHGGIILQNRSVQRKMSDARQEATVLR